MIRALLLIAVTFIASSLGTIVGFGIATLMTPLLLLLLPAKETILFVAIIHWCNDLWKMLLFPKKVDKTLLWYFGVPTLLATIIGALSVFIVPEKLMRQLVGLLLIIFIIVFFSYRRFFLHPSRKNVIGMGIISGFFGGLTGIRGALIAAALTFHVSKEVYIATIGAIQFIIDSTRLIIYGIGGLTLSKYLWLTVLISIPTSYAGAKIGAHMVEKIPQEWIRRLIVIIIFGIGIRLLIWP